MTLYEALMDIDKGRFIDNGCDYDLVALAKGIYTFELSTERSIAIKLDGTPAENARKIEADYYNMITPSEHFHGIYHASYKKIRG